MESISHANSRMAIQSFKRVEGESSRPQSNTKNREICEGTLPTKRLLEKFENKLIRLNQRKAILHTEKRKLEILQHHYNNLLQRLEAQQASLHYTQETKDILEEAHIIPINQELDSLRIKLVANRRKKTFVATKRLQFQQLIKLIKKYEKLSLRTAITQERIRCSNNDLKILTLALALEKDADQIALIEEAHIIPLELEIKYRTKELEKIQTRKEEIQFLCSAKIGS